MNGEKTTNSIYKSPKWETCRARALRRDGYICQRCKRYGRIRAATTVHHMKPVEEYPELAYDLDNLESLCEQCHNKTHPEKGSKGLRARQRSEL